MYLVDEPSVHEVTEERQRAVMTTRTLATWQTSGANLASPLEERRLTGWPSLPLAIAITGMALLRVLVAANTGLTDDEAYYRLWALVPAISYVDHPPMTAWMIAAGMWCVGDNPVGIRLAAPLTSLVIPFVMWRTTAILFDRGKAECATWFTLAMPLLAVSGVIVTPDTPSVLFWGLTVWALAELHNSRNANWWLAVGLFSGLGLLSKYVALFLGAGIALWIAHYRRTGAGYGAGSSGPVECWPWSSRCPSSFGTLSTSGPPSLCSSAG